MYIYIVYKQQDFNSDLLHRNLHVLHWKANDYILLERPLPTSSLLPLHKDTKLHSSAVDRADMSSAAEPKRPRFSSADTHKCHIHIIHNIDIYIYIQILNLYILILYFILDIPQCHCRTRHKTSLPPESSTSEQWDLHDLHAPENLKPSQQQWLFKVTALMLCLANFWTLEPQCACPTEKQELGAELVSLLVSEHSLRIGPEYSQQFIATTMDFTSMSNWCAETQNTSKSITCNLCFPLKVSTCSSSARQVLWWKCSSRASLHFSPCTRTRQKLMLFSVSHVFTCAAHASDSTQMPYEHSPAPGYAVFESSCYQFGGNHKIKAQALR